MIKKQFKVLMITTEAVPFAKSGGLADVVSALSRTLRVMGHDVRIVMPRYYFIDRQKLTPLEGALGVPLSFGQEWAGVYGTSLPDSEVPVYFLEHEGFFGRNGIYGPKESEAFADNAARFTFLCRAGFQLCKKLGWYPDITHSHDWPTALAPVFLYTWERHTEFKNTAGVLSIHNLGYQGVFSKHDIHYAQLPWEHFHGSGLEFHERLNFLKAGILNADILTTVSPTYAEEIQTPALGCTLDEILRFRRTDLFGILNGIDYGEWNPETDPFIPAHFTHKSLSGKKKAKQALQKELGLPVAPDKPVIGMVTRLVDQKGIGDLCYPTHGKLYDMCKDMDMQFAVIGSGEAWCEAELKLLSVKLPNLKVFIGHNNRLAHLIEAGSDFFLMPSRYEPCGLNQMYSLRYGTLPIVRKTGGLADTVENYDETSGEGTGFMFDNLTPKAIYNVVGWAVWAWYNKPEHIKAMRTRAMQKRFPWKESAEKYTDIYQWALDRRLGYHPRTWK